MNGETSFLTLADKKLAYQQWQYPQPVSGAKVPGLIFLSGYGSDMMGTKAGFLAERCAAAQREYLRFDYQGHGQSSGAFIDGTIGRWFQDTLDIFDRLTGGPQILVGSSMGGWIALLLARARPERVAAVIGIAAAPDFTERLVMPNLTSLQTAALERDGVAYDENAPADFCLPMTRKLIEEARNHLLLDQPLQLPMPVHLLQGQADTEVPWRHALEVLEIIEAPVAYLTLIKDGDHRLSRPHDLALIAKITDNMAV